MSGIERTIVYGLLAVMAAGIVWLWRRVDGMGAAKTEIAGESAEIGTLKAKNIVVSDAITLVRADGKTVGFLMSMDGGGFLKLFGPETAGSAHVGYRPFAEPLFSVGAHLGETGITLGATPMGRRLVRTTLGTEKGIERVDYEFDGEKLTRTPPR